MRSTVAIGVGSVLLIILPTAGAIGGAFLGHDYARPREPVCGLFVFAYLPFVVIAAALGLTIGVAIGFGSALTLIRWANRGWVEVDVDPVLDRE